jgi:hypothetical protein
MFLPRIEPYSSITHTSRILNLGSGWTSVATFTLWPSLVTGNTLWIGNFLGFRHSGDDEKITEPEIESRP